VSAITVRRTVECIPPASGMTTDLDVYRAAGVLVKECRPEQAPLMAAKPADAMLEFGDLDGERTWKAVLRAVRELTRTERRPSKRVN
jgi:hypothetical protein